MAETVASDENISQFLSFTGSSDPAKAASYLEMSGNNVETAVGLYMEHETTGGGGGTGRSGGGSGNAGGNMAGAGGFGDEEGIRAPDETRSMQLMPGGGDDGGMMMMGGFHPAYQMMSEMMQAQLDQAPNGAFASPSARRPGRGGRAAANNRALLDQAIAAQAQGVNVSGYLGDTSMMDDDDFADDDDDANYEESKTKEPARLSDMFAAPTHIMHVAGGFQGARTMAKDTKRWLLVNIQRDAEFASHALNRDVWRDELVENLIREGFIFWQQVRIVQTFVEDRLSC
jgi:UBX domain-containing protein 7